MIPGREICREFFCQGTVTFCDADFLPAVEKRVVFLYNGKIMKNDY